MPGAVDPVRVVDAMVTVHKTHGSRTTVEAMRRFFENDHVHMALIVDDHGRLVSTLERSDLAEPIGEAALAARFGTLEGRTVRASDHLDVLTARLRREGRRRMAVIDDAGRLVGLLCLKRSGKGYCTNDGIRAREDERHAPTTTLAC